MLLITGCGETPQDRELRVLQEANESLRQRLTVAEENLAKAQRALADRDSAPAVTPEPMAQQTTIPSPDTTPSIESAATPASSDVEDTTYIVVAKHHVPGQFIPQPTGADPGAAKRVAPVYQVTFKGAQSSRIYPPLNVTESAYPGLREGVAYPRAALNAAKTSTTTTSATGSAGNGNQPPIDFDSIFGTR